ncbi:protein SCO2 homolog, mitochondrial [Pyrgilauda ruficollis]|uniref:protein SCO2 homolog, mitochondrial n=1 Tax=Pyrgilauda ruficollis TaxID=221976 RepID=UPI001B87857A|nr:protein SCO2 homolog, mitochondrial [Pyrgilauda ruficollis]
MSGPCRDSPPHDSEGCGAGRWRHLVVEEGSVLWPRPWHWPRPSRFGRTPPTLYAHSTDHALSRSGHAPFLRGPAPCRYFRFRRQRRGRSGRDRRRTGRGDRERSKVSGDCTPRLRGRGRLGGAAAAGWLYLRQQKERQQRSRRLRQLRRLALGQGDFQLRDSTGAARSKADFLGRWVLLYFGFTHCPDVCPEQLERLSRAVRLLERDPALPPLQPLFVTVDPERDDEAALARYLRDFHPRLLGLTGTPEQVRAAAAAFRVYVSAGPRDADGDYVVDHSVLTFLVDPDGLFRDCYGSSRTAEEMARSVKGHMDNYEPLPPEGGQ